MKWEDDTIRKIKKNSFNLNLENLPKIKKQDRDEKSGLILDYSARPSSNRCDIWYSTLNYIEVRQMEWFYSFFLKKNRATKKSLCAP